MGGVQRISQQHRLILCARHTCLLVARSLLPQTQLSHSRCLMYARNMDTWQAVSSQGAGLHTLCKQKLLQGRQEDSQHALCRTVQTLYPEPQILGQHLL